MKRMKARIYFLAPSFIGVFFFVLLPFGDVVRRSFMTAVTKEGAGIQNYSAGAGHRISDGQHTAYADGEIFLSVPAGNAHRHGGGSMENDFL